MIWLTWRQFRVQAVSVAAALVAIAILLLSVRPTLTEEDGTLYFGGIIAMYVLPALIGIFWGVPLVSRELEAGTHNVVWNQTVTRTRWLATKLALPGAVAVASTGLLSLVVGWWASPIDTIAAGVANPETPNRIEPVLFAARGIVPIGYAAFAFVLGVLVGLLMRRMLTAMAVTLVVFIAVLLAMPFLVRPYLLPPTDQQVEITAENIRGINANGSGVVTEGIVRLVDPLGSWVITNETVDPDGNPATRLPKEVATCAPPPPEAVPGPSRLPSFGDVSACFAKLNDLGYRQHMVYQPASMFWPLQWLETALFAVLTALLTWLCFRSLRRLT